MCKRNWRQYNKALVQRGRLSFLIDPQCLKKLEPKKHKGPGLSLTCSDPLILMRLLIKMHFKLPYRMLEGFEKYLLQEVRLPTYSLTCKQAIKRHLTLPRLCSQKPHTILVDLSGIKVFGEGKVKDQRGLRNKKRDQAAHLSDARAREFFNTASFNKKS